ncbi:uncharacterized protein EMH_0095900 [Eimeria mitis]|uniref:Uncharacterized protein n=1 Tax=Eimeria mitis TaxID=44415 RepID=U6JQZ8_9EIME|nr:uncharacterized protein EMH_0095900 [Eimeria mitis]CDJ27880.1 hypothetical protein EMH_0095900 [Eimeria mitis]
MKEDPCREGGTKVKDCCREGEGEEEEEGGEAAEKDERDATELVRDDPQDDGGGDAGRELQPALYEKAERGGPGRGA